MGQSGNYVSNLQPTGQHTTQDSYKYESQGKIVNLFKTLRICQDLFLWLFSVNFYLNSEDQPPAVHGSVGICGVHELGLFYLKE